MEIIARYGVAVKFLCDKKRDGRIIEFDSLDDDLRFNTWLIPKEPTKFWFDALFMTNDGLVRVIKVTTRGRINIPHDVGFNE